jgi:hypothetical protein
MALPDDVPYYLLFYCLHGGTKSVIAVSRGITGQYFNIGRMPEKIGEACAVGSFGKTIVVPSDANSQGASDCKF